MLILLVAVLVNDGQFLGGGLISFEASPLVILDGLSEVTLSLLDELALHHERPADEEESHEDRQTDKSDNEHAYILEDLVASVAVLGREGEAGDETPYEDSFKEDYRLAVCALNVDATVEHDNARQESR